MLPIAERARPAGGSVPACQQWGKPWRLAASQAALPPTSFVSAKVCSASRFVLQARDGMWRRSSGTTSRRRCSCPAPWRALCTPRFLAAGSWDPRPRTRVRAISLCLRPPCLAWGGQLEGHPSGRKKASAPSLPGCRIRTSTCLFHPALTKPVSPTCAADFLVHLSEYNRDMPENMWLLCGDNRLGAWLLLSGGRC